MWAASARVLGCLERRVMKERSFWIKNAECEQLCRAPSVACENASVAFESVSVAFENVSVAYLSVAVAKLVRGGG